MHFQNAQFHCWESTQRQRSSILWPGLDVVGAELDSAATVLFSGGRGSKCLRRRSISCARAVDSALVGVVDSPEQNLGKKVGAHGAHCGYHVHPARRRTILIGRPGLAFLVPSPRSALAFKTTLPTRLTLLPRGFLEWLGSCGQCWGELNGYSHHSVLSVNNLTE
jgi:microcompartment protein CcmK/EutM